MGRLSPLGLGATIALAVWIIFTAIQVNAAPVQENSTSRFPNATVNSRFSNAKGCYFLDKWYPSGEQIDTNEPCLNCTCVGNALLCYLRVCPFVKPVGESCVSEMHVGDCCPKYWCPEVYPRSSTESSESPRGCFLDGRYYDEGARIPMDPLKPCEVCYCIRNTSICTMQECELKVSGCYPEYKAGSCCPSRYNCTEDAATTIPPGIMEPEHYEGCIYNDVLYQEGDEVPSIDTCQTCYCMKHEVVCAVHNCTRPAEDCEPVDTDDGECCPKMYKCPEGTEIPTTTEHMVSSRDMLNVTTVEPVHITTEVMLPSTTLLSLAQRKDFFTTEGTTTKITLLDFTTPQQVSDSSPSPPTTQVTARRIEADEPFDEDRTLPPDFLSRHRAPKITEVPDEMFTTPARRNVTARPIFRRPIPGEGICRHENRTFQNGEEVPSSDPCLHQCKCTSSVVRCVAVECVFTTPATGTNCQLKKIPGECCRQYVCDETNATTPVALTTDKLDVQPVDSGLTTEKVRKQTVTSSTFEQEQEEITLGAADISDTSRGEEVKATSPHEESISTEIGTTISVPSTTTTVTLPATVKPVTEEEKLAETIKVTKATTEGIEITTPTSLNVTSESTVHTTKVTDITGDVKTTTISSAESEGTEATTVEHRETTLEPTAFDTSVKTPEVFEGIETEMVRNVTQSDEVLATDAGTGAPEKSTATTLIPSEATKEHGTEILEHAETPSETGAAVTTTKTPEVFEAEETKASVDVTQSDHITITPIITSEPTKEEISTKSPEVEETSKLVTATKSETTTELTVQTESDEDGKISDVGEISTDSQKTTVDVHLFVNDTISTSQETTVSVKVLPTSELPQTASAEKGTTASVPKEDTEAAHETTLFDATRITEPFSVSITGKDATVKTSTVTDEHDATTLQTDASFVPDVTTVSGLKFTLEQTSTHAIIPEKDIEAETVSPQVITSQKEIEKTDMTTELDLSEPTKFTVETSTLKTSTSVPKEEEEKISLTTVTITADEVSVSETHKTASSEIETTESDKELDVSTPEATEKTTAQKEVSVTSEMPKSAPPQEEADTTRTSIASERPTPEESSEMGSKTTTAETAEKESDSSETSTPTPVKAETMKAAEFPFTETTSSETSTVKTKFVVTTGKEDLTSEVLVTKETAVPTKKPDETTAISSMDTTVSIVQTESTTAKTTPEVEVTTTTADVEPSSMFTDHSTSSDIPRVPEEVSEKATAEAETTQPVFSVSETEKPMSTDGRETLKVSTVTETTTMKEAEVTPPTAEKTISPLKSTTIVTEESLSAETATTQTSKAGASTIAESLIKDSITTREPDSSVSDTTKLGIDVKTTGIETTETVDFEPSTSTLTPTSQEITSEITTAKEQETDIADLSDILDQSTTIDISTTIGVPKASEIPTSEKVEIHDQELPSVDSTKLESKTTIIFESTTPKMKLTAPEVETSTLKADVQETDVPDIKASQPDQLTTIKIEQPTFDLTDTEKIRTSTVTISTLETKAASVTDGSFITITTKLPEIPGTVDIFSTQTSGEETHEATEETKTTHAVLEEKAPSSEATTVSDFEEKTDVTTVSGITETEAVKEKETVVITTLATTSVENGASHTSEKDFGQQTSTAIKDMSTLSDLTTEEKETEPSVETETPKPIFDTEGTSVILTTKEDFVEKTSLHPKETERTTVEPTVTETSEVKVKPDVIFDVTSEFTEKISSETTSQMNVEVTTSSEAEMTKTHDAETTKFSPSSNDTRPTTEIVTQKMHFTTKPVVEETIPTSPVSLTQESLTTDRTSVVTVTDKPTTVELSESTLPEISTEATEKPMKPTVASMVKDEFETATTKKSEISSTPELIHAMDIGAATSSKPDTTDAEITETTGRDELRTTAEKTVSEVSSETQEQFTLSVSETEDSGSKTVSEEVLAETTTIIESPSTTPKAVQTTLSPTTITADLATMSTSSDLKETVEQFGDVTTKLPDPQKTSIPGETLAPVSDASTAEVQATSEKEDMLGVTAAFDLISSTIGTKLATDITQQDDLILDAKKRRPELSTLSFTTVSEIPSTFPEVLDTEIGGTQLAGSSETATISEMDHMSSITTEESRLTAESTELISTVGTEGPTSTDKTSISEKTASSTEIAATSETEKQEILEKETGLTTEEVHPPVTETMSSIESSTIGESVKVSTISEILESTAATVIKDITEIAKVSAAADATKETETTQKKEFTDVTKASEKDEISTTSKDQVTEASEFDKSPDSTDSSETTTAESVTHLSVSPEKSEATTIHTTGTPIELFAETKPSSEVTESKPEQETFSIASTTKVSTVTDTVPPADATSSKTSPPATGAFEDETRKSTTTPSIEVMTETSITTTTPKTAGSETDILEQEVRTTMHSVSTDDTAPSIVAKETSSEITLTVLTTKTTDTSIFTAGIITDTETKDVIKTSDDDVTITMKPSTVVDVVEVATTESSAAERVTSELDLAKTTSKDLRVTEMKLEQESSSIGSTTQFSKFTETDISTDISSSKTPISTTLKAEITTPKEIQASTVTAMTPEIVTELDAVATTSKTIPTTEFTDTSKFTVETITETKPEDIMKFSGDDDTIIKDASTGIDVAEISTRESTVTQELTSEPDLANQTSDDVGLVETMKTTLDQSTEFTQPTTVTSLDLSKTDAKTTVGSTKFTHTITTSESTVGDETLVPSSTASTVKAETSSKTISELESETSTVETEKSSDFISTTKFSQETKFDDMDARVGTEEPETSSVKTTEIEGEITFEAEKSTISQTDLSTPKFPTVTEIITTLLEKETSVDIRTPSVSHATTTPSQLEAETFTTTGISRVEASESSEDKFTSSTLKVTEKPTTIADETVSKVTDASVTDKTTAFVTTHITDETEAVFETDESTPTSEEISKVSDTVSKTTTKDATDAFATSETKSTIADTQETAGTPISITSETLFSTFKKAPITSTEPEDFSSKVESAGSITPTSSTTVSKIEAETTFVTKIPTEVTTPDSDEITQNLTTKSEDVKSVGTTEKEQMLDITMSSEDKTETDDLKVKIQPSTSESTRTTEETDKPSVFDQTESSTLKTVTTESEFSTTLSVSQETKKEPPVTSAETTAKPSVFDQTESSTLKTVTTESEFSTTLSTSQETKKEPPVTSAETTAFSRAETIESSTRSVTFKDEEAMTTVTPLTKMEAITEKTTPSTLLQDISTESTEAEISTDKISTRLMETPHSLIRETIPSVSPDTSTVSTTKVTDLKFSDEETTEKSTTVGATTESVIEKLDADTETSKSEETLTTDSVEIPKSTPPKITAQEVSETFSVPSDMLESTTEEKSPELTTKKGLELVTKKADVTVTDGTSIFTTTSISIDTTVQPETLGTELVAETSGTSIADVTKKSFVTDVTSKTETLLPSTSTSIKDETESVKHDTQTEEIIKEGERTFVTAAAETETASSSIERITTESPMEELESDLKSTTSADKTDLTHTATSADHGTITTAASSEKEAKISTTIAETEASTSVTKTDVTLISSADKTELTSVKAVTVTDTATESIEAETLSTSGAKKTEKVPTADGTTTDITFSVTESETIPIRDATKDEFPHTTTTVKVDSSHSTETAKTETSSTSVATKPESESAAVELDLAITTIGVRSETELTTLKPIILAAESETVSPMASVETESEGEKSASTISQDLTPKTATTTKSLTTASTEKTESSESTETAKIEIESTVISTQATTVKPIVLEAERVTMPTSVPSKTDLATDESASTLTQTDLIAKTSTTPKLTSEFDEAEETEGTSAELGTTTIKHIASTSHDFVSEKVSTISEETEHATASETLIKETGTEDILTPTSGTVEEMMVRTTLTDATMASTASPEDKLTGGTSTEKIVIVTAKDLPEFTEPTFDTTREQETSVGTQTIPPETMQPDLPKTTAGKSEEREKTIVTTDLTANTPVTAATEAIEQMQTRRIGTMVDSTTSHTSPVMSDITSTATSTISERDATESTSSTATTTSPDTELKVTTLKDETTPTSETPIEKESPSPLTIQSRTEVATTAETMLEDMDNCVLDGTTYELGQAVITKDPCEKCHCSSGGITCFKVICKVPRSGCKAITSGVDECCSAVFECPTEDGGTEKVTLSSPSKATEKDVTTPIPISFMFSTTPSSISSTVIVTKSEILSAETTKIEIAQDLKTALDSKELPTTILSSEVTSEGTEISSFVTEGDVATEEGVSTDRTRLSEPVESTFTTIMEAESTTEQKKVPEVSTKEDKQDFDHSTKMELQSTSISADTTESSFVTELTTSAKEIIESESTTEKGALGTTVQKVESSAVTEKDMPRTETIPHEKFDTTVHPLSTTSEELTKDTFKTTTGKHDMTSTTKTFKETSSTTSAADTEFELSTQFAEAKETEDGKVSTSTIVEVETDFKMLGQSPTTEQEDTQTKTTAFSPESITQSDVTKAETKVSETRQAETKVTFESTVEITDQTETQTEMKASETTSTAKPIDIVSSTDHSETQTERPTTEDFTTKSSEVKEMADDKMSSIPTTVKLETESKTLDQSSTTVKKDGQTKVTTVSLESTTESDVTKEETMSSETQQAEVQTEVTFGSTTTIKDQTEVTPEISVAVTRHTETKASETLSTIKSPDITSPAEHSEAQSEQTTEEDLTTKSIEGKETEDDKLLKSTTVIKLETESKILDHSATIKQEDIQTTETTLSIESTTHTDVTKEETKVFETQKADIEPETMFGSTVTVKEKAETDTGKISEATSTTELPSSESSTEHPEIQTERTTLDFTSAEKKDETPTEAVVSRTPSTTERGVSPTETTSSKLDLTTERADTQSETGITGFVSTTEQAIAQTSSRADDGTQTTEHLQTQTDLPASEIQTTAVRVDTQTETKPPGITTTEQTVTQAEIKAADVTHTTLHFETEKDLSVSEAETTTVQIETLTGIKSEFTTTQKQEIQTEIKTTDATPVTEIPETVTSISSAKTTTTLDDAQAEVKTTDITKPIKLAETMAADVTTFAETSKTVLKSSTTEMTELQTEGHISDTTFASELAETVKEIETSTMVPSTDDSKLPQSTLITEDSLATTQKSQWLTLDELEIQTTKEKSASTTMPTVIKDAAETSEMEADELKTTRITTKPGDEVPKTMPALSTQEEQIDTRETTVSSKPTESTTVEMTDKQTLEGEVTESAKVPELQAATELASSLGAEETASAKITTELIATDSTETTTSVTSESSEKEMGLAGTEPPIITKKAEERQTTETARTKEEELISETTLSSGTKATGVPDGVRAEDEDMSILSGGKKRLPPIPSSVSPVSHTTVTEHEVFTETTKERETLPSLSRESTPMPSKETDVEELLDSEQTTLKPMELQKTEDTTSEPKTTTDQIFKFVSTRFSDMLETTKLTAIDISTQTGVLTTKSPRVEAVAITTEVKLDALATTTRSPMVKLVEEDSISTVATERDGSSTMLSSRETEETSTETVTSLITEKRTPSTEATELGTMKADITSEQTTTKLAASEEQEIITTQSVESLAETGTTLPVFKLTSSDLTHSTGDSDITQEGPLISTHEIGKDDVTLTTTKPEPKSEPTITVSTSVVPLTEQDITIKTTKLGSTEPEVPGTDSTTVRDSTTHKPEDLLSTSQTSGETEIMGAETSATKVSDDRFDTLSTSEIETEKDTLTTIKAAFSQDMDLERTETMLGETRTTAFSKTGVSVTEDLQQTETPEVRTISKEDVSSKATVTDVEITTRKIDVETTTSEEVTLGSTLSEGEEKTKLDEAITTDKKGLPQTTVSLSSKDEEITVTTKMLESSTTVKADELKTARITTEPSDEIVPKTMPALSTQKEQIDTRETTASSQPTESITVEMTDKQTLDGEVTKSTKVPELQAATELSSSLGAEEITSEKITTEHIATDSRETTTSVTSESSEIEISSPGTEAPIITKKAEERQTTETTRAKDEELIFTSTEEPTKMSDGTSSETRVITTKIPTTETMTQTTVPATKPTIDVFSIIAKGRPTVTETFKPLQETTPLIKTVVTTDSSGFNETTLNLTTLLHEKITETPVPAIVTAKGTTLSPIESTTEITRETTVASQTATFKPIDEMRAEIPETTVSKFAETSETTVTKSAETSEIAVTKLTETSETPVTKLAETTVTPITKLAETSEAPLTKLSDTAVTKLAETAETAVTKLAETAETEVSKLAETTDVQFTSSKPTEQTVAAPLATTLSKLNETTEAVQSTSKDTKDTTMVTSETTISKLTGITEDATSVTTPAAIEDISQTTFEPSVPVKAAAPIATTLKPVEAVESKLPQTSTTVSEKTEPEQTIATKAADFTRDNVTELLTKAYKGVETTTSYSVSTAPPDIPTTIVEDDFLIDDNTCFYEGGIYQSAQQIPRTDPCEFCFCFRGDIICLQQSCPPPAPDCIRRTIPGYCCPRYDCPVLVMSRNLTQLAHRKGAIIHDISMVQKRIDKRAIRPVIEVKGCQVKGRFYELGSTVSSASGPCLHCVCQEGGVMRCDPLKCKPQAPLMLKMNNDFFRTR